MNYRLFWLTVMIATTVGLGIAGITDNPILAVVVIILSFLSVAVFDYIMPYINH